MNRLPLFRHLIALYELGSSLIKFPTHNKQITRLSAAKEDDSRGAFILHDVDLSILLLSNPTRLQICAFIALASCKDRNFHESYSTGGQQVLRSRIGIGSKKAEAVIADLLKIEHNGRDLMKQMPSRYDEQVWSIKRLIGKRKSPEELQQTIGKLEHLKKTVKRQKRWQFNSTGKKIWLHRDLVYGKERPLELLNRIGGNLAARVFIFLHRLNNVRLNAVTDFDSHEICHYEADIEAGELIIGDYAFLKAKLRVKPSIASWFVELVHGKEELPEGPVYQEYEQQVVDTLTTLERLGFIYKVVMVEIFNSDRSKLETAYELDCKTDQKYTDKNNLLLAGRIRQTASLAGFESGRKDNRFYDEYVAIYPVDTCLCESACNNDPPLALIGVQN